jgi:hypothetical protein
MDIITIFSTILAILAFLLYALFVVLLFNKFLSNYDYDQITKV